MTDMPGWLAAAVDAHLEGRGRRDLAARSARISTTYRAGGTSKAVVNEAADALAYAVARMPATFAAASRVFAEIADLLPDFAPRTVLDAGAGPGTAGFAALERWPGAQELVQADHNPAFLDLARSFAEANAVRATQIRCELSRMPPDPAGVDLTILCYVLAEGDIGEAANLAERMWRRTLGAFVVVEPGTPAGYRRILAVRERLLELGAAILAPCPHESPCPLEPPDWCHFAERVARRRAHMAAKHAVVPFEDEPFAYLVAVRPPLVRADGFSRIIAPPAASKAGIAFKLCRADGSAGRETASRRNKPRHARARRLEWGDRLEADGNGEAEISGDGL